LKFRAKNSLTVYSADDLWPPKERDKVNASDVLDRLIDNLASLADLSEFAASMPEIVLTVSTQLWVEFEKAQAYGYLQATDEGVVPNTEYRYLVFQLAKSSSKLIIQEGPSTSTLEIVS
jgi:hypothetical protein